MKSRSRAIQWTLYLITGAYWIFIFTLTHLPPSKLPQTHVSDKLAHFAVYSILGILLFLCISLRNIKPLKVALLVIVIAATYGALDELTQPYFQRDCSIYDWYADLGGTVTAALLGTLVRLIS